MGCSGRCGGRRGIMKVVGGSHELGESGNVI